MRTAYWSQAIAVGRSTFVEKVQNELGAKAIYRGVERGEQTSVLREESARYGRYFAAETDALSPDNAVFWDDIALFLGLKRSPTRIMPAIMPAFYDVIDTCPRRRYFFHREKVSNFDTELGGYSENRT